MAGHQPEISILVNWLAYEDGFSTPESRKSLFLLTSRMPRQIPDDGPAGADDGEDGGDSGADQPFGQA